MRLDKNFFHVYITTNLKRDVLYIGVTNHIEQRLVEHYLNRGKPETFAGRYYCYYLLYYEPFQYVNDAISREKELKKWSRKKKDELIIKFNPEGKFLNSELFSEWPPHDLYHRKDL
jgi:putative endonuclease